VHKPFEKIYMNSTLTSESASCEATPTQLRWQPFPIGELLSLGIKYQQPRIHDIIGTWKFVARRHLRPADKTQWFSAIRLH
jgi:hypothetical protein